MLGRFAFTCAACLTAAIVLVFCTAPFGIWSAPGSAAILRCVVLTLVGFSFICASICEFLLLRSRP